MSELPTDIFPEVTLDYEIIALGGGPYEQSYKDVLDVTSYYQMYIDTYYQVRETALAFDVESIDIGIDLSFLTSTFHEEYTAYINKIGGFDMMAAGTGNEFNPFYIGVEFFITHANKFTSKWLDNGANIGFGVSEEAPSNDHTEIWLNIFGEIFENYWRQTIYTASPMVEWIKWVYAEYNPMDIMMEYYTKYINVILGFEPECPGV